MPAFDAFRYAHDRYHEVAWLSQNTNHLVPPSVIEGAIQQALREHRYEGYPFASGLPELKSLVLGDLGFPAGSPCLVTAGGTESLYMSARALLSPGDEVIASDPSYLIIHRFIELSGARTVNLPIYSAPWRLTADRVNEAVTDKTRMILLIDPLNPLGSGYPESEVRAIAEIAHDRHLLLLNDVTYRDFAETHTLAARFAPEETLTVWSVSKNCGLAGMRLGGVCAPTEMSQKIGRYNTNDLGVNIFAQVAAVAALRTKKEWFPTVRAQSRKNQEAIRSAVAQVPDTHLLVFPSQANMFVIDIEKTGIAPEALQRELLERHQVFVRAGDYLSPKFGGRFVRLSFSNPPKDVARFVEAFPLAIAALRKGRPVEAPARS
ncbi:MAG: pyridoxal phosphate-dependent aminotransferase [Thermoplasmata archaeon]|nr:pyridoxal phosphate-dependent aminotransferase [Thermoplasmata archaeon]